MVRFLQGKNAWTILRILDSAVMVLNYGPFACFLLTLLLMVTTLIVLGACKWWFVKEYVTNICIDLRRDTYEDYTFPLSSVTNDTFNPHGFELFSLRNYAKHYGKWRREREKEMTNSVNYSHFLAASFSKERYAAAVNELVTDANTHYHTAIGWGTGFEIIATVFIFIVTALTFLLGTASRSDNL